MSTDSQRICASVCHPPTGDVRKILFGIDASFSSVLAMAAAAFGLPPVSADCVLQLKYVDEDGDRVTLSSDEELREALRCAHPGDKISFILLPTTNSGVPLRMPVQAAATDSLAILAALAERRDGIAALMPQRQLELLAKALAGLTASDAATVVVSALASEQVQGVLPHVVSLLTDAVVRATSHAAPSQQHVPMQFGALCSVCHTPITNVRYKCLSCLEFSMCEGCERFPNAHDPSHPLLKGRCQSAMESVFSPSPATSIPHFTPVAAPPTVVATEAPLPQQQQAQQPPHTSKRFTGEFVQDVTLPTGTQLQTSQKRIKIWRLRNSGTEVWPDGCRIEQTIGEPVISAGSSIMRVPPAAPGKTVDVAAEIITPSYPGVFETVWQVVDPDGVPVVQDMKLVINIPAEQNSVSLALAHAPAVVFPQETSTAPEEKKEKPVEPPAVAPAANEPVDSVEKEEHPEPPKQEEPRKPVDEPKPEPQPEPKPKPEEKPVIPQVEEEFVIPPEEDGATPTPLEVFKELGLNDAKCQIMRQLEGMGFTNFEKLLPLVKKYDSLDEILNRVFD